VCRYVGVQAFHFGVHLWIRNAHASYLTSLSNHTGGQALVLEAVKQNGLALQFASESLQNDIDVVHEAIKQDPGPAKWPCSRSAK